MNDKLTAIPRERRYEPIACAGLQPPIMAGAVDPVLLHVRVFALLLLHVLVAGVPLLPTDEKDELVASQPLELNRWSSWSVNSKDGRGPLRPRPVSRPRWALLEQLVARADWAPKGGREGRLTFCRKATAAFFQEIVRERSEFAASLRGLGFDPANFRWLEGIRQPCSCRAFQPQTLSV